MHGNQRYDKYVWLAFYFWTCLCSIHIALQLYWADFSSNFWADHQLNQGLYAQPRVHDDFLWLPASTANIDFRAGSPNLHHLQGLSESVILPSGCYCLPRLVLSRSQLLYKSTMLKLECGFHDQSRRSGHNISLLI